MSAWEHNPLRGDLRQEPLTLAADGGTGFEKQSVSKGEGGEWDLPAEETKHR